MPKYHEVLALRGKRRMSLDTANGEPGPESHPHGFCWGCPGLDDGLRADLILTGVTGS